MEEDDRLFFAIPRKLDTGRTFCGLPQDEVLPALIIFLTAFFARHEVIGICLAAIWFTGLRGIKASLGTNFIKLTLYWFAPSSLVSTLFKKTPPASQKYWLN